MRISRRLPLAVLVALVAALVFVAAPAMADFGLDHIGVGVQNQDGTPDMQAGSHPYSFTGTFVLKAFQGTIKDSRVELPPGFVGDPDATARCAYQDFTGQEQGKYLCSSGAAVGVATVYLTLVGGESVTAHTEPVYNLVPPPGVAAEFGFLVAKATPVLLQVSVRTGGDYGLTVSTPNINQAVVVAAGKVTIWGVPANPAHNLIRGQCESTAGGNELPVETVGLGLREDEVGLESPIHLRSEPGYSKELDQGLPEPTRESEKDSGCPDSEPEVPLLTNPTSCGVPRTVTFSADSWEEQGDFATGEHVASVSASLPELVGCEKLDFSPTTSVSPDGSGGSTPTGLSVDLHVPQESTETPLGWRRPM